MVVTYLLSADVGGIKVRRLLSTDVVAHLTNVDRFLLLVKVDADLVNVLLHPSRLVVFHQIDYRHGWRLKF